jgi:hypothetical protein
LRVTSRGSSALWATSNTALPLPTKKATTYRCRSETAPSAKASGRLPMNTKRAKSTAIISRRGSPRSDSMPPTGVSNTLPSVMSADAVPATWAEGANSSTSSGKATAVMAVPRRETVCPAHSQA